MFLGECYTSDRIETWQTLALVDVTWAPMRWFPVFEALPMGCAWAVQCCQAVIDDGSDPDYPGGGEPKGRAKAKAKAKADAGGAAFPQ